MEIPEWGIKKIKEAQNRKNWTHSQVVEAIHEQFEDSMLSYSEDSYRRNLRTRKGIRESWTVICTVLGLTLADITQEEELGQDYELEPVETTEDPEDTKDDPSLSSKSVYVERPPIERECYQEIQKEGALIRIRASQKMGKTILMNKMLRFAEEECDYKTAYLDLAEPETSTVSDLSYLLKYFIEEINYELEIPNDTQKDWWEVSSELDTSETSKCRNYLEKNILKRLDTALVLGIDNVDRLFDEPLRRVAVDFFGMLRAWHNRGKRKKGWEKFKVILVYSTEKIPDFGAWESPFNVGLEKTLQGFNEDQILCLSACYRYTLSQKGAKQLSEQLDGHPYLINLMLEALSTDPKKTLESLLEEAHTDEGIYRKHFQNYWKHLHAKPELAKALSEVVKSDTPQFLQPPINYELESFGLVKRVGNEVKIRCELYRRYFLNHLTVLDSISRGEFNDNR